MRKIRPKTWIFLAAALVVVAALQAAQTASQNGAGQDKQNPAPQKSTAKPSKNKPPIAGAVRASTDAALEDAAKQAAKKPDEAKQPSVSEAVVEFHPTEAAASTRTKTESQKTKKAKDVHGTVYGATDAKNAGTHRAGGAVGATSKSGKTSVYVETQSDRTTPPH